MKAAVVLGVGPSKGLGATLARRFAGHDLHIVLGGRTAESLATVAAEIETNGGTCTPAVCDATDESAVAALIDAVPGTLELAIYNVGNNTPGRISDMSLDYFEQSLRLGPVGGFLFGRATVNRMMKEGGGTLLYTGASASLRGRKNFGAFNASKGALRNLAQAMAKEYAEHNIHVGHVVIDGPVGGDKIELGFPEYAAKLGEAGTISLEGIADAFEFLYRQPPRAWSFEVDVRTSQERW
ncbi:MAG: SDR family NAD(P)-dependent oxidoreductase [Pseudomonadota bacterium]